MDQVMGGKHSIDDYGDVVGGFDFRSLVRLVLPACLTVGAIAR